MISDVIYPCVPLNDQMVRMHIWFVFLNAHMVRIPQCTYFGLLLSYGLDSAGTCPWIFPRIILARYYFYGLDVTGHTWFCTLLSLLLGRHQLLTSPVYGLAFAFVPIILTPRPLILWRVIGPILISTAYRHACRTCAWVPRFYAWA